MKSSPVKEIQHRFRKNKFLFEELVKRDFKQKYKRTVLGMGWSILSPLLTLLVMRVIFINFFGRSMDHYTTYLFCGNLVFTYFRESTKEGMNSLMKNSGIFSKINVPKYIFLLSKNVSTLINFGLSLVLFFIFAFFDDVQFSFRFLMLVYPVLCLVVFNIGIGMILSAVFVFYKDVSYLYDVFTRLLMYLSAIFYTIDSFPQLYQNLFLLNPVYVYIRYFRDIVLAGTIPTLQYHLLCAFYAIMAVLIGSYIYKKYNHKFVYYV